MKKIKNIIKKIVSETKHLFNKPWNIFLKKPLKNFVFNRYSQHGEDGIIEEIFRKLNIKNGLLVEFGAWDGKYLSNTYNIVKNNKKFKAIYIEGDKKRCGDLKSLSNKLNGRITPICAFVSPQGENSLDNILKKTSAPKDFELLSIDVDGMDYYIWENFKEYNPKIVIIEINCSLPSSESKQTHDPSKNNFGSSFAVTLELGNKKGYSLVHHKGNMFFIRNDLLNP